MAETTLGLIFEVNADPSQAEGALQSFQSSTEAAASGASESFGTLTNSAVFGFHNLQRELIETTQELGALKAEILTTTDAQEKMALQAKLGDVQAQYSALRTEMRGLRMETLETRETADLLAESFGVKLPGGIATALARLPGLQTVMASIFPIAMGTAFLGVLAEGIEKLRSWREEAEGIGKVWDKFLEKQQERQFTHEPTIAKEQEAINQLRSEFEALVELGNLRQQQQLFTNETIAEQWARTDKMVELEKQLQALGIDSSKVASEKVRIQQALEEAQKHILELEKQAAEAAQNYGAAVQR